MERLYTVRGNPGDDPCHLEPRLDWLVGVDSDGWSDCLAVAQSAPVPRSHRTAQLGRKRYLWRKALATRTVTRSSGMPHGASLADDSCDRWLYPLGLGPCVALGMAYGLWGDAHSAYPTLAH